MKNSLAVLVRIMEQTYCDGIVARNPVAARVRSPGQFAGWGWVVTFAAYTAARIGEVSSVRVGDIDVGTWTWTRTMRRQTTPLPGGLVDKGTKGKRAHKVPLIAEVRELVTVRIAAAGPDSVARLFACPRGGRITTAVLRDATHWDEVVIALEFEHLRRDDLRHTGLTWMADAGVPVHVLRKIAGTDRCPRRSDTCTPTPRGSRPPVTRCPLSSALRSRLSAGV